MWHKAGPVVTAVLAVGLILTLRRLSDVQTKLELMRGMVRVPGVDGAESPFTALDASDLAREWEQAVAPMDS
jgi:hypothetical protein